MEEFDGYRRGRDVDPNEVGPNEVRPLYRPLVPIIWGVGVVIIVVLALLGFGLDAIFAVVLVTHTSFAGLIRWDIRSLRRQGVAWGGTRHLWFGAAIGLPFVAPAYYLYSGRVVRRENASRGVGDGRRGAGPNESGLDDATDGE